MKNSTFISRTGFGGGDRVIFEVDFDDEAEITAYFKSMISQVYFRREISRLKNSDGTIRVRYQEAASCE